MGLSGGVVLRWLRADAIGDSSAIPQRLGFGVRRWGMDGMFAVLLMSVN